MDYLLSIIQSNAITGIPHRLLNPPGYISRVCLHRHFSCKQIHFHIVYTGYRFTDLLHPGGASSTGPTGNDKFQFHTRHFLFLHYP